MSAPDRRTTDTVGQRAITQQLLLGALREHDASMAASEQTRRAGHLVRTSRLLSGTLEESATYDAVLRVTLPGRNAWCILEIIESDGSLRRFGSIHPDVEKQALARSLDRIWAAEDWPTRSVGQPGDCGVVSRGSGPALERTVRDADSLRVLDAIGFGSMLVVPLVIRGRPQGTIIFVSGEREPPFVADEITLAVEIAAICGIALDNARLYAEATTMRRKADEANKAKSTFLATMSHELRTPLNAIGGFVELIDLGLYGPVTPAQSESLGRVKANQMQLLTVITQILDFARVDGGRADLQRVEVWLHRTIVEVATMLDGVARDKRLSIIVGEGSVNVAAWGDPDRIRQIVLNLVMNAIKYSAADSGPITVTTSVEGDRAVLRVSDHGPGIPAHMLEAVFQPFVQMNDGLADRLGGVGLGLAISRELALAMKGNITVKSMVGAGSTFTLTLPRPRSDGQE